MSTARAMFFADEPRPGRVSRTHLLKAMFNQLSDAVVLYDKNLEIVGLNQAAEHLFGMIAEEIIGQDCAGLFHCSSCEPHESKGQALAGPTCLPTGTFNLHVKNGRQRLVVIRTVQLRDGANAVEGVVATIEDITEESHPVVRRVIAESQAMRDLLDLVRKIAVSEATSVLIEGENGAGKDLAKTLHDQSPRQAEPFLAINCAAIPETLLESELFGFEKGAFTDARAQKRGLFELADKGTLFMDDIGEMSLPLQAKLFDNVGP